MKKLYLTLLLLAAAQLDASAGYLFREVTVRPGIWEVVFREQGARYSIEIDEVDRGTSGYLQRLRLLSKESLRLIDRHSNMDIKPATVDGEVGVRIITTYQDRFTGEQKTKTIFEPNHEPKIE